MGTTCNTHERNKECTQSFDTLKTGHNSEELGLDGRIILKKYPRKSGCEKLNCTELAQKGIQW